MSTTEEFLEHYGVKGQKWGVRRRHSLKKGKQSPRPSDEGRAAAKILDKQKKFGTVSLTNHELRVINARIKLEKEFKNNFPPPKNKLEKGEAFVKRAVAVVGTAEAAYKIFNGPLGRKLTNRGKKVMTVKTVNTTAKAIKFAKKVP